MTVYAGREVAAGVVVDAAVAIGVDVITRNGVVCTRVLIIPGLGVLVQVGVNVGRRVGALVTSRGAVVDAAGGAST